MTKENRSIDSDGADEENGLWTDDEEDAERRPSVDGISPSGRGIFLRHQSSSSGRSRQRSLSNASTTSTNVSDSEYFDQISEMSSLLVGDRAADTAPPATAAYGVVDAARRPLTRIPSEESIQTVTALPGMLMRCHSISSATASGRRNAEGRCTIRQSTTKVALKAAQLERRAARRRQQNNTALADTQQSAHNGAHSSSTSSSSFVMKESYWIDIETPRRSSEELFEFLQQLRIPPLIVSILSEPSDWTSEVVALNHVSLAVFQILPTNPSETVEITRVALLSMPRLLVTFHTFEDDNSDTAGLYRHVANFMKQRERVPEPSSSGVLLSWLQFHVRRTAHAIRELRAATMEMDEDMDEDFAGFEFDRLVEAKNCLLRVRMVAEEQHGTLESLTIADQSTEGFDFSNCRGALAQLRANASSNERHSSRIDKHLNELRERIMAGREVTLNQRLALLTLLSAIFMPLTLLSGIWGMNFENMPELQVEWAYPVVLLGMFCLALCMVYSFQIAGWAR